MSRTLHRSSPCLLSAAFALCAGAHAQNPGYTDTPLLPDGRWRVHDAARPHPPIIAPGVATEPQLAPADAIVLFDGSDLRGFTGKQGPAKWTLEDGCMTVDGSGDVRSKAEFGDCQLHLEWAAPAPPEGESQHRGNSGVFLMDRYEVQILDSYDNVTYADGQAAALYGQYPPMVNCCRPPGEWQTYDIVFRRPRFAADGSLASPARVTVLHNGVLVHLDRPLWGPTAHRSLPRYEEHGPRGPIRLQDHGSPVRFRNIWVRELDLGEPTTTTEAAPVRDGDEDARRED